MRDAEDEVLAVYERQGGARAAVMNGWSASWLTRGVLKTRNVGHKKASRRRTRNCRALRPLSPGRCATWRSHSDENEISSCFTPLVVPSP